ncbi:hypothetical protein HF521_015676 [Silurus meridionalis]|uniref:C2H2-type domain-containing protein n=1 Tax=Silurus meridionalis TaxID=175797 RepID=A0A8T0A765_SILME|nr:hypothetical protein HF521_015676 [Silurus meridionalis]
MLAANQYFLSGMPTNASLEQFLVQQGPHNHLGLTDSNTGLAPPPALHPSHTHAHPTPQPQQQQQQLPPHALSHPHTHAHPHHPLHPAPQPSPLSGFDFQGIPVLSSNQLASLMQQEAGLPLPLPLHLSAPKDDGKGDSGSGSGGSGSRRKKAMAGYLPQRKSDGSSGGSSSSTNCHSSSGAHGHDGSSGLVGGGAGVGMRGLGSDPSSILSSSTPSSSSSSTVSSSAPSSNSASVLVTNVSQIPKSDNQSALTPTVTQPEPYHCGECGKSFTELPSLRRHIRSHEEGRNGPNSSVNTTPNTVHQHQSDTSLPHSTQDGLSQQNAHQHEPNQSNPDPTSSCPSPDKTYCCTECGKGFKKRGHLLQHGVIHSGARPYACSTCERSFNRESLTRHEKIHEDKPYRCPACDRCFRESTSLLNHAASGSCGKPGRGSSSRSSDGSSASSDDKVEGSEYQGGQLNEKGLGYPKTEGGATEMSCAGMYSQSRGGNPNTVDKPESKYNSAYSRDPYQTSYRVDDYRRPQSTLTSYSGDGSCTNSMSGPALRKAPLAPTLHPHPSNQQQQQQQHHHHQQQPHLPLSSLLDDSDDEVTSSAMSAIAAAAAASVLPEINSNGGREERRDIIGGLLGGLGFGTLGGPSSTSAANGGNDECVNGSMMPLSHPAQQQQQPNSQNATSNAKPKRPRKPRQKREPRPGGIAGEGIKRRRNNQNGARGDGAERPYLCTVCGRGFGRRETLRRHERVHTGEKPFHCDVCGKDFREPFHLTKHQTVHSGEKNFKCSLCGKDFGYAQSLKRHEKLHLRGDFKPRRSKTKSSANQAAAVHQDGSQTAPGSYYSYSQNKAPGSTSSTSNQPPPKLYTCDICWKSFRHHFHLTAHHQAIHEHGGEKLFSCEVCGKAFAYSNSLTRHRLSQHGLSRAGPTPQPTGSGSGGNATSLTESEAATNVLLSLAPDNGSHGVQQTHSTIAHTHLHSQPAGYSPLFYTPESGPHSSNTNAPSHPQHPHYSHSTLGPLSHQQPISGKGQQIYQGITGNPIHSVPPHIHISSSPLHISQYHHQQHSFQMQPQHLQHQLVQVHGDAGQKKKKKKKKKNRFFGGGQLIGGFSEFENARWHQFLQRKKTRLQQQLKRKRWIAQLNWAKYTGGLGLHLGVGTPRGNMAVGLACGVSSVVNVLEGSSQLFAIVLGTFPKDLSLATSAPRGSGTPPCYSDTNSPVDEWVEDEEHQRGLILRKESIIWKDQV